MESKDKSNELEPTITDVMGVVNGLAVNVQGLTEDVRGLTANMQNLTANVKEISESLQDLTGAVQIGFAKNDSQHDEMKNSISDVGYRVTAVEKRTGAIESAVEDMKDILDGVAMAIDKDAITVINHEVRITRLEDVCV
jgi:uncharacterized protein YoxC